jgi:hypothetical protein
MMIINPYLFAPAPLLLDTYSGASGGYSIRKLRTAYLGSSIRVRRSNDNSESDIGFVNNQLDTSSLLSFVGSNNGFVTTFYDQSGNGNNLIQTTAARQPQIVSSGTTITLNGNPSLRTQTVLQGFVSTNNFTFTQSYIATVFNRTGRIGVGDTLYIFDGSPYNQLYSTTSNWSFFYGSAFNTTIPLSTSQKLLSQNYNGTTHFFYDNSNLNSQVNAAITITNLQLQVMATFTFNYGTQGNLQEFIIYTTNKTTDRSAIETNIKTYYGI